MNRIADYEDYLLASTKEQVKKEIDNLKADGGSKEAGRLLLRVYASKILKKPAVGFKVTLPDDFATVMENRDYKLAMSRYE